MKSSLSQINILKNKKEPIPDIIHFVWIGDIKKANTDYIGVWHRTNLDKEIYLWCDENACLINFFHDSIHNYVLSGNFENIDTIEKNIKNDAYNYLLPKLMAGGDFDDTIIKFLEKNDIPFKSPTRTHLPTFLKNLGMKTKNIAELFTHDFKGFLRYYYYEIILRGNLASASDIARLLIIYQHGGIYIDVDTLPYIDNVFHETNTFLKEHSILEDDVILMMKTKALITTINSSDLSITDSKKVDAPSWRNNQELYIKIAELISVDMGNFSIHDILPLGRLSVHKNLLSLASLKRLRGVYFNNVLISHVGSKVIRIILRVMKKRYAFLEKNNCIFDFCSNDRQHQYLSRLMGWRSELITKKFCVTPALTGPGLIVEVLLGLAYTIFELDSSTSPSFIAEYMQEEKLGIAFYRHNLDTPEGMTSAWRK
ncbi:TcdA/TcdB catalytic glycosyltransferase domain-containing protein [Kosakonia cowanii]|uniref:TcdA/TcdB catalytic glycosyltransferase domain-containing protein n=1 Tax=Kosakonia cowanii TaxID=208223 RepID=UPI004062C9DB